MSKKSQVLKLRNLCLFLRMGARACARCRQDQTHWRYRYGPVFRPVRWTKWNSSDLTHTKISVFPNMPGIELDMNRSIRHFELALFSRTCTRTWIRTRTSECGIQGIQQRPREKKLNAEVCGGPCKTKECGKKILFCR